jgi:hypothetical protein
VQDTLCDDVEALSRLFSDWEVFCEEDDGEEEVRYISVRLMP